MDDFKQKEESEIDFSPIWAEIDLNAVAHNIRELRSILSPSSHLMAVVKANGYGHGSVEVAGIALQNGADCLGVARINEGITLRKAGIDSPILIFSYTHPSMAKYLAEFNLTQTISSYDTAAAFSSYAASLCKTIKIHIKIDTGMGRLGLMALSSSSGISINRSAVNEIVSMANLPYIKLEGIFTHFATADSIDKTYSNKQFKIFMKFLNELDIMDIKIPIKHAANSAAIIDLPATYLNMARAGISIYGLYPSNEVNKKRISLIPAMTLKTRVIHTKTIGAGFKISYGSTYETSKPTTVVTVPVGYADGLNRLLSSRGSMLLHGVKIPIIGRICMDHTMLDAGNIQGTKIGDEVVILGKQGNQCISADDIASKINTINYEVVCMVTSRVRRIYLR